MEKTLEFFFELPNLKPFGLSPGETTKKDVEKFIKEKNVLIMEDEKPSPTQDNLYNPNATEWVLGGLKNIYGFPLKGVILNFYKETMDKLFCILEPGEEPEVTFFTIFNKLEKEVFGQTNIIQTSAELTDWEISWSYRFFSISLMLHRDNSHLILAFSDKSLQRVIIQEEKTIFSQYVEKQMGKI